MGSKSALFLKFFFEKTVKDTALKFSSEYDHIFIQRIQFLNLKKSKKGGEGAPIGGGMHFAPVQDWLKTRDRKQKNRTHS